MKRLYFGIAGIALSLMSAFLVYVIAHIVSTEVMPAARAGSLNVETSSMILNVSWEGNEIYFLIVAYALLAIGLALGAVRTLKRAFTR